MTPASAKIKRWREDPVFFATDELKMQEVDDHQVELLRAFADPNKIRIGEKACKGVGKTTGLAICILNFMACYAERGEHPKGAATSITEDNIDDNLWPEIAKWQGRSEFLKRAFTWTKSRYFNNQNPETWFFSKRTWPKTADLSRQADTLAGLHAKYLLFVLDESGGIPDGVMAAAEGGLSTMADGHFVKIVQAGNPTHLSGPLYRAATTDRHLWHLITITGDPKNPKRSKRQSIVWAQQQIDSYGADNPWVKVNVFGEFPPSAINSLFGPDEVEEAMKRHLDKDAYDWAQKRLGVDVARFGDDRTVLFPRQGLRAFRPIVMRHDAVKDKPSVDIANQVMRAKLKWGHELAFIDDTGGWAKGAIDVLGAAGQPPQAVVFHGKAMDPRYKNRRAEMWLEMQKWLKSGGAIPEMPELTRELVAPTFTFTNGQFLLEPKDMIKARLGYSPDLADGLALTFAMPDMPAMDREFDVYGGRERGKLRTEYDPFANRDEDHRAPRDDYNPYE